MELSTEIQEARRKLGLSQSQAAKAWDVKLITLQSWEQGVRKPRGFALKHLRGILDAVLSVNKAVLGTAAERTTASPNPTRPRRPPPSRPS